MYPAALENYWLERARRFTAAPDDETALEKLRPAAQRLSDLFTVKRPDGHFPDYAADPPLLLAYGLFFFPQSYVRARLAFDQPTRFRGWRPQTRGTEPVRLLDLGSGAGPCGLALADALGDLCPQRPVALTALDHSPAALAALREIANGFPTPRHAPPRLTAETRAADLRRASATLRDIPPQDLIVAGFAANELFGGDPAALRDWLAALGEKLAPGGLLLVLEPALRETAVPLRHAADALAAAGKLRRWAPDLSDTPEPLCEKHWPHEVRRWDAPASLAFLNRRLFREIGVLKFSYTALGNTPPPPLSAAPAYRLVSPLEALNGRLLCAVADDTGHRLSIEVPTRGLSKSAVKKFAASLERGDIFTLARPPQALGTPGLFRALAPSDLLPLYTAKNENSQQGKQEGDSG
ncbi:MAG: class I SAM-dependent methyltransferase [Puniceicoccales bacterium]|jgi:SAM-dependent methyltransferase|nr:class I SAM-dependent methyltransferase [Puniceicoccales bacterium]